MFFETLSNVSPSFLRLLNFCTPALLRRPSWIAKPMTLAHLGYPAPVNGSLPADTGRADHRVP